MGDLPALLDYGALGLLALVLTGVGIAMGRLLTAQAKQNEEIQQFTRGLVTNALRQQNEQADEMQRLVKSMIDTQASMTGALRELTSTIKVQREDTRKEHHQILANVDRLQGRMK